MGLIYFGVERFNTGVIADTLLAILSLYVLIKNEFYFILILLKFKKNIYKRKKKKSLNKEKK